MMKRLTTSLAATALGGAATVALAADGAAAEPHLVSMDTLAVPIIDGGRVTGLLNVKLVLSADDAGGAGAITANMARLRSAALAGTLEFGRLYASPFKPVNSEVLAEDLTSLLHAEEAAVAKVLIVEVAARR